MVTPPTDVVLAALRGRNHRLALGSELTGRGVQQADEMASRLAMAEDLDRADLLNLRTFFSRDHVGETERIVADQLGGDVMRAWLFAELPERPLLSLSDRLAALDNRLSERILGQMETVFRAAVGRTALKVAKAVRRSAYRGKDATAWLDDQPVTVVRAAITDIEEAAVLSTVDDLDELIRLALANGSKDLASILDDELGLRLAAARFLSPPAVDAAVNVGRRSLASLVLGRLSRNDATVITSVPRNMPRDVLHVAGGADSSPNGGVPKSDTGRVLVAGMEASGDGFATSNEVVQAISQSDPERTVRVARYWQHSGAGDPVPEHLANNGKRDVDCDFSAGSPGALRNCGCSWRTELEVIA